MRKKNYSTKIHRVLLAIIIYFVALMAINSVSIKAASPLINTSEEFFEALSKQQAIINVDDIDFGGQRVTLNYSVTITGHDSKLKGAYFVIVGSDKNNDNSVVKISFKGIDFDGGFDLDETMLSKSESFEDIFGSAREDNRCIDANRGYYELTLEDSRIHNYASELGPAIFLENDNRDYSKSITIENCSFYDNVSYYDTIHLSNDLAKVKIINTDFYHNYGYKGMGFSVTNAYIDIDSVSIHDNRFVSYDINKDNFQLCGGGLYIGGCKGTVNNAHIYNNESTFGGALGIASSRNGDYGITLTNLVIENNKAKYGGAVVCHSLIGQPIVFINTVFKNNQAELGSSLYTLVYAHFNKANDGGLVQILFSSFINNTATDKDSFSFYRQEQTKGSIGIIDIRGSYIIGEDQYLKNESYNYQNTLDGARSDGAYNDGDAPIRKSPSDIKIKRSEYITWNEALSTYTGSIRIGYGNTYHASSNRSLVIIITIAIAVVVATGTLILIIKCKKKKEETKEEIKEEVISTPTSEIDATDDLNKLTKRELSVAYYTVNCKKRKEIADLINYSEETVKKDLTSIYLKLDVKEKSELIVKYGAKINEYFNK